MRVNVLLADEARQEGWLEAISEFQVGVRKSSQEDYENAERRNQDEPDVTMEAEPAVYYDGEIRSDESEHDAWLDNPRAERMARAMALKDINESGLTPEQIIMLYGPPDGPPADPASNIDFAKNLKKP